VVIFTIAGIIYGWEWLVAGIEKLPWLTNGKLNSASLIKGLIANLAMLKFSKYAEFIGIDGYLRYKRGKEPL